MLEFVLLCNMMGENIFLHLLFNWTAVSFAKNEKTFPFLLNFGVSLIGFIIFTYEIYRLIRICTKFLRGQLDKKYETLRTDKFNRLQRLFRIFKKNEKKSLQLDEDDKGASVSLKDKAEKELKKKFDEMTDEEKKVLSKDLKDLTKEEIEVLDNIADKDIVIEDDDDIVLADADEDEEDDAKSSNDTSSDDSDDKKTASDAKKTTESSTEPKKDQQKTDDKKSDSEEEEEDDGEKMYNPYKWRYF